MTLDKAKEKVCLGSYEHFKGSVYVVYAVGIGATDDTVVVFYKNSNGEHFTRKVENFIDNVFVDGVSVPRFKFLSASNDDPLLKRQKATLFDTITLNKKFWDEQKAINPAFPVSGGGDSLKYVVGDKISFAKCLGIITDKEGAELFRQVVLWS